VIETSGLPTVPLIPLSDTLDHARQTINTTKTESLRNQFTLVRDSACVLLCFQHK
jgi:hypothetical protein